MKGCAQLALNPFPQYPKFIGTRQGSKLCWREEIMQAFSLFTTISSKAFYLSIKSQYIMGKFMQD